MATLLGKNYEIKENVSMCNFGILWNKLEIIIHGCQGNANAH